MDLSILDFGPIGAAVELVQEADRLGYRRYWMGEHHSRWQCSNPLLLGALLAATSDGIRVGSGGVCLAFQSPYKIAEDARLIEFMVPGKFDLGVARGLRLEPELLEAVLDGKPEDRLRDHYGKLAELHGFLTGRQADGSAHAMAAKLPFEEAPPMWLLGTSTAMAQWAGRHGVGFCFSLHHALPGQDQAEIFAEYRAAFVPSPEFPQPAAILVVTVACAATNAEAREHAKDLTFTIVGSVAECAARLAGLADRYGVDELMLLDLLPAHRDGLIDQYAALAAEVGLTPRDVA